MNKEFSIKGFQERLQNKEYYDSITKYWKKGMKDVILKYMIENNLSFTTKYINKFNSPIVEVNKMEIPKKFMDNKTKDIHRQVFIKIASEQVKGSVKDLIKYAQELEKEFNMWE